MNTKSFLPILACWLLPLIAQGQACKDISILVLGSGGPEINDQRASSSYLIAFKGDAKLLLDVGSGSHTNFERSKHSFNGIEGILLSHLHTDHSADLPAYIKGSYFTNRSKDLAVIGPNGNNLVPSTTVFLERLFGKEGAFSYLHDYLEPGAESYLITGQNTHTNGSSNKKATFTIGDFTVAAMAVNHGPIPAVAWQINLGNCRIVYLGDTSENVNKLAAFAYKADLLIAHNAIPDHAGRIAKNLHITPQQIIPISKQSQAKRVLVSHFMKRTEDERAALQERLVKEGAGQVYMASDLMTVDLDE